MNYRFPCPLLPKGLHNLLFIFSPPKVPSLYLPPQMFTGPCDYLPQCIQAPTPPVMANVDCPPPQSMVSGAPPFLGCASFAPPNSTQIQLFPSTADVPAYFADENALSLPMSAITQEIPREMHVGGQTVSQSMVLSQQDSVRISPLMNFDGGSEV